MMTKKNVFVGSVVWVVVLLLAVVIQETCDHNAQGFCWRFWSEIGSFGEVSVLIIPIFLLSLVTYKMREEAFHAWWNFARWWIPVIVIVTILQSTGSTGGGYLSMEKDFNILVLGLLYTILVLGSLWKIIKVMREPMTS